MLNGLKAFDFKELLRVDVSLSEQLALRYLSALFDAGEEVLLGGDVVRYALFRAVFLFL